MRETSGGAGGGGGGGESVRVIVRLRPEEQQGGALAGGKDMAGSCILGMDDHKLTIVDPRRRSSSGGNAGGGGGDGKRGEEQHQQAHDFSFDRVFGPEATQGDVFDTVKPLVHATVDGEMSTVVRGRDRKRSAVDWVLVTIDHRTPFKATRLLFLTLTLLSVLIMGP